MLYLIVANHQLCIWTTNKHVKFNEARRKFYDEIAQHPAFEFPQNFETNHIYEYDNIY